MEDPSKARPWMEGAEIDFLESVLKPEWDVLEYGCGGSTAWMALRVRSVLCIEHNAMWLGGFSWPANVTICLIPPAFPHLGVFPAAPGQFDKYTEFVWSLNRRFDFVLVDGRNRIECAKAAWRNLVPGGMMAFHDWTGARYQSRATELARYYAFLTRTDSLALFQKVEPVELGDG